MANPESPNQAANKSKAEGERWTSEPDSVEQADRDTPVADYPQDDGDNAGGITNRTFDEEVDNQESLPPRGMSKDEPRISEEGTEMDREADRSER